ncbi:polyphosphate kinase 2 family protein [Elioraea tepida]|uniref:Polyphosphate kinase 2 family protein n=1 Tax=Elioraea tepida TaxID=2843330 RepID=A0A975U4A5_9PROT|nr:polyphosphate kinase 2 family protein [Elioraea tepida]QXM25722.1 polyphosphate kinase 2 family protein [Elioraea tepida]
MGEDTTKGLRKRALRLLDRYRVTEGKGFRLKRIDPADTAGLDFDKAEARSLLAEGTERLAALQERLYADDRYAILLIFQAMDAAGKDSTIKHVMSGVNPQGCQVTSFKHPSAEALDHDFLHRHQAALPERGRIGIHNRSWYEEVLVVRVHPEILAAQKLPAPLVTKRIWTERLADIAAYERYLARQGTVILKFFLHVSKEEQKRRFLERIDRPEKNWKFSMGDIRERGFWDDYQAAYEEAIRATAAPHAPWFVVPADNKWFTRLVVCAAVVTALEDLDLRFPEVTEAMKAELEAARTALLAE